MELVREQFSQLARDAPKFTDPKWTDLASRLSCGRSVRLSRGTSLPLALFGLALGRISMAGHQSERAGANANGNFAALRPMLDLAYVEGLLPIPAGVAYPTRRGRLQMFDAIPMGAAFSPQSPQRYRRSMILLCSSGCSGGAL
jgi:hypothetical protein